MDLSGYTDIARGIARCFGYDLMINFNRPYLARTVSNFWQRWHISMSGFFREYLYWPMGGSKRGNVYLNLMVTFVAIGVWHGAGWNLIVYGILHGSIVCLERVRRLHRRKKALPDVDDSVMAYTLGICYTFLFVSLVRVLFVSSDLEGAWAYFSAIWSTQGRGGAAGPQGYVTLIAAIALHCLPRSWEGLTGSAFFRQGAFVQACLMVSIIYLLVMLANEPRPFVYFKF